MIRCCWRIQIRLRNGSLKPLRSLATAGFQGPFGACGDFANSIVRYSDPVRLAILSALEALETADYVYLLTLTGLTRGNMSTHLRKLEKNGLIETERGIRGRKPRTLIWLTAEGQKRISGYWSFMRSIQHRLQLWTEAEGRKSWTEHLHRVYGG